MIGVAFPVISPLIRAIVPSGFDKYFMGSNEKLESLMVGFLNAGVFVIAYWMLEYKTRYQVFAKCSVGTIMLLLNLCFFGLNLGLDHASRMAALFGPYLIVFVPQMLSLMESKIKRKNAAILIAIVCGCQYVLRLLINNIGGTMPYRFFW